MNGTVKVLMLAAVIGTSGLAQAQVETFSDNFNDGVVNFSIWGRTGESYASMEEAGGIFRMVRNTDFYAAEKNQMVYKYAYGPGPNWDFDGMPCDNSDVFIIRALVKAPHRINYGTKSYQIGIGFTYPNDLDIELMVEDTLTGRRLVAKNGNTLVKTAWMSADDSTEKWWLKITYSAASRKFVFWRATYAPGVAPNWVKFSSTTVLSPPIVDGKIYLLPGIHGYLHKAACPATWNVGVDTFSVNFTNN